MVITSGSLQYVITLLENCCKLDHLIQGLLISIASKLISVSATVVFIASVTNTYLEVSTYLTYCTKQERRLHFVWRGAS